MKEQYNVFIWFTLFIFFMLADLVLYYNDGHIKSVIPLILTTILTLIVLVITIMATYEIIKHRNDEEEW